MSDRNNEDRLGTPDEAVASFETPRESRFEFLEQTEIIELPTRGLFYAPGHPLHGQSTVELRWPSMKQMDILNNKSNIRENLAVDRFLDSLFKNPMLKSKHLMNGDKAAVIIASRIMLHGETFEGKINCPLCFEANEFSVDLSSFEEFFPEEELLTNEGVKVTDSAAHGKTFRVVTPKTNSTVVFRLMNGEDLSYLSELEKMRTKKKLPFEEVTEQLRRIILSVNNNSDPSYVNSFLSFAPAQDCAHVIRVYRKIEPGIPMGYDFDCKICGNFEEVQIPLDIHFFWPKR